MEQATSNQLAPTRRPYVEVRTEPLPLRRSTTHGIGSTTREPEAGPEDDHRTSYATSISADYYRLISLQREILCLTVINQGSLVSYSYSVGRLYRKVIRRTTRKPMSADFLNNLTVDDENTLMARLGLMTFTSGSTGERSGRAIRDQIWSQIQPTETSPAVRLLLQIHLELHHCKCHANGGTPTAQRPALRADLLRHGPYNDTPGIAGRTSPSWSRTARTRWGGSTGRPGTEEARTIIAVGDPGPSTRTGSLGDPTRGKSPGTTRSSRRRANLLTSNRPASSSSRSASGSAILPRTSASSGRCCEGPRSRKRAGGRQR